MEDYIGLQIVRSIDNRIGRAVDGEQRTPQRRGKVERPAVTGSYQVGALEYCDQPFDIGLARQGNDRRLCTAHDLGGDGSVAGGAHKNAARTGAPIEVIRKAAPATTGPALGDSIS
jgi:hypothetical protein